MERPAACPCPLPPLPHRLLLLHRRPRPLPPLPHRLLLLHRRQRPLLRRRRRLWARPLPGCCCCRRCCCQVQGAAAAGSCRGRWVPLPCRLWPAAALAQTPGTARSGSQCWPLACRLGRGRCLPGQWRAWRPGSQTHTPPAPGGESMGVVMGWYRTRAHSAGSMWDERCDALAALSSLAAVGHAAPNQARTAARCQAPAPLACSATTCGVCCRTRSTMARYFSAIPKPGDDSADTLRPLMLKVSRRRGCMAGQDAGAQRPGARASGGRRRRWKRAKLGDRRCDRITGDVPQ